MLCQSCGKKTATTHIKTIVNGKLMEYHLCTDCAKHKGYGNIFSNWGMDFSNLLGGFLGNSLDNSQVTRCPPAAPVLKRSPGREKSAAQIAIRPSATSFCR